MLDDADSSSCVMYLYTLGGCQIYNCEVQLRAAATTICNPPPSCHAVAAVAPCCLAFFPFVLLGCRRALKEWSGI